MGGGIAAGLRNHGEPPQMGAGGAGSWVGPQRQAGARPHGPSESFDFPSEHSRCPPQVTRTWLCWTEDISMVSSFPEGVSAAFLRSPLVLWPTGGFLRPARTEIRLSWSSVYEARLFVLWPQADSRIPRCVWYIACGQQFDSMILIIFVWFPVQSHMWEGLFCHWSFYEHSSPWNIFS